MPYAGTYAAAYPMAPYAGLFILPVGLCILLGAGTARFRMPLVWAGFALGALCVTLLGSHLGRAHGATTTAQLVSLAAAIIFEITAFVLVMRRLADRAGRRGLLATLTIVALHFLIMTPAFGPMIAGLGIACLLNAASGWQWRGSSAGLLWAIDGALKFAAAILLVLTAPAFV